MIVSREDWPKLSALLDNVLELPQEQRLTWIDALSTESAETRTQLRELLTATAAVDELLHKPPNFSAALLAELQHVHHIEPELQAEKLAGPYRLLRELGQGGMGAVWLAQRVDGKFKREVALKFPYAGPRQRELAERLQRERDILASLEHPNIARLYDADITPSGQPFLVLEYIDGIPIGQYCDQQTLSIRQRLQLFLQVISAVRYAHHHLIIHRDIKPSNILITADGAPHLLDFGIAKSIAEGDATDSPLTQFMGHALTPEYASPEQAAKTSVTTASDVYSLGVVLYQLLTGSSPYRFNREQRAQLDQAILSADVISPSHADISDEAALARNATPKQIRKSLRGEIDTLLLKALKKDTDSRYTTADAFYEDIQRYLNRQPIHAQPDTQWYRIKKFTQRNRVAVAAFSGIAFALIAGASFALWQAHIAAQQRDRALALAERGEAVTEFMRTMVTEIAAIDEPITLQTLLTRTENVVTQSFANNKAQQAALLELLGDYYFGLDRLELAKQLQSKALTLATSSSDRETIARLQCDIGRTYVQLGDSATAQEHVNIGLAAASDYPEVKAICLEARAFVAWETDDNNAAIQYLHLALDSLHKSGQYRPDSDASLLSEIAASEISLGDAADAERDFSMAMDQLKRVGRGEQSSAMVIENNWSAVGNYLGNPRDALLHLDRAKAIERKHLGAQQVHSGYASNYALLLFSMARYADSLQEYRLALQSAEAESALMDIALAKLGMARTLIEVDRIAEANELIAQVDLSIKMESTHDSGIIQKASYIKGILALKQKRYGDAIPIFSSRIEYYSEHHSRVLLPDPLILRAAAYLGENNSVAALADATQAYDTARVIQSNLQYSGNTGKAALQLAKIELKQNHSDKALEWATIAYRQLRDALGDDHPVTQEAKQLVSLQAMH